MHRVKPFGVAPGQMDAFHGTNLESRLFDALNDAAGKPPFHRIRLDDRQRSLGHRAIITVRTSAAGAPTAQERAMAEHPSPQSADPDRHKGAIEGDRPDDEQIANPHGDGVNEEGLPDDPIAT